MNCPNCGGLMYDNRTSKTNPKAPDFRCKDANCIDPETNRVSAVWLKKTTPAPRPAAGAGRPGPAGEPEIKTRAMVMAYAKDIVVAQLQTGSGPETPVKSAIMAFRLLWREVKAPGSVIFKGDQVAEPEREPEPEPEDPAGLDAAFPPEGEENI